MIKIKWANWRIKENEDLAYKYDIATIVLKQKGIYFDPSDEDFLDKVFKEYTRRFLKSKRVKLKLSPIDIFFYGENANVYLLNHIYNEFFPNKPKNPFNPIIKIEGEGAMNLHLFNGMDEQVLFLIEILDKMEIDFKKLGKKYMLLEFPQSLECYDEDRVYKVRYGKWKKREGSKL